MSSRWPSTCTYSPRPRAGDVALEAVAQRSVAGDHEVRVLAERVHRDQHVERAVGSLLLDQVADEADEPDVVGEPELGAQMRAPPRRGRPRRTARDRESSGSPRSVR